MRMILFTILCFDSKGKKRKKKNGLLKRLLIK